VYETLTGAVDKTLGDATLVGAGTVYETLTGAVAKTLGAVTMHAFATKHKVVGYVAGYVVPYRLGLHGRRYYFVAKPEKIAALNKPKTHNVNERLTTKEVKP